jgi:cyclopropane fatty-acyl-phospholipid synthase-like methyltransferase
MRILVALAISAWIATSAAQSPPSHDHRFHDAGKWAQVFDDPKRDAMQKPHEVIKALALKPDAVVADIGAGTGYFSVRLAHAVPKGRVYAADVEPDMVKYLGERIKKEQLANVRVVSAAPDDPRLPEKVDLALLVDVYHHIGERPRYLAKLAESLKPGGRVALIDFRPDARQGPPRKERISAEAAKSEFAKAGFDVVQEHRFLPEQYFVVFAQPKR